MDLDAIRRRRMRQLIDEKFDGKQARLAKRLSKQPAYVNRWFTDKAPHQRNISERMARQVESIVGLPPRWLDEDTEAPVPPVVEPGVQSKIVSLFPMLTPAQLLVIAEQMERHKDENEQVVRSVGRNFATVPNEEQSRPTIPHVMPHDAPEKRSAKKHK